MLKLAKNKNELRQRTKKFNVKKVGRNLMEYLKEE
jgi:hypothetical protein